MKKPNILCFLLAGLISVLVAALALTAACRGLEISGGTLDLSEKKAILARSWPAQVVGITDGDTVKVRLQGEGEQIRVRLYGIDAPEKGQPFGRKSRDFLAELALIGASATVEPVNFDRYGRLVAIIYGPDGRCLNEAMVAAGLAWVYPKYCDKPVCRSWAELEDAARRGQTGLWGDKTIMPPWEWRKNKWNGESL